MESATEPTSRHSGQVGVGVVDMEHTPTAGEYGALLNWWLTLSGAVVSQGDEGASDPCASSLLVTAFWSDALGKPAEVEVQPSARPHITDKVQSLLEELLRFLVAEARRNYVIAPKVEVTSYRDPEEDTTEVVVTQWVRLPPASAMEYWDRLAAALEVWAQQLPGVLKRIATERLAIEVRWE